MPFVEPPPTNPLDFDPLDLLESGRGLAMIEAAVDEVHYARDGDTNRWTLVKRLPVGHG